MQMQFNNAFGGGGNYNVVVGTSGATNFYTSDQTSAAINGGNEEYLQQVIS
jgi:hypothetical protein